MFGSWVLNEIWIMDLSSALTSLPMSSSKLFLFSNEAHLNCYWNCTVLKSSSMLPCLLICAKLTMAFTFTSLPLNFYTSFFRCGCGFGFEQKFWRIDGFGEKKSTDRRICITLFTPLQVGLVDWRASTLNEKRRNYFALMFTPTHSHTDHIGVCVDFLKVLFNNSSLAC